MTLAPVCVLAGGVGSRLGERVASTPKPLLEVAGRPFLDWQLELLSRYGARRAVLCVGYLGEQIASALGDERHGIELIYRHDPPGLAGTAGAIRGALDALGDAFLVLYGDTYLRIDYADVWTRFTASGRLGLMTVLENAGRWDRSNASLADGLVRYDKHHPTADMRWIDYGLGCLHAEALDVAADAPDLAEVYAELSRRGELAGYPATERFYEIGTPSALAETEAFLLG